MMVEYVSRSIVCLSCLVVIIIHNQIPPPSRFQWRGSGEVKVTRNL